MQTFHEIQPGEIAGNPFTLIGKDWMLVTAGDAGKFNTMTASWGGVGVLWNKNVVFTFIRPQRYTYEFIEKGDIFTLSFFDDSHRDALKFCGANSGRDVDKVKETGLTPVFTDGGVYFEEAKLVLVCRKLACQDMDPAGFIDPSLAKNYAAGDYHRMYAAEILKVYQK